MILGVAGDLLGGDEPRTHYLTKVGGAPWVPCTSSGLGPICCDWHQSTTCGACGRGLSLVFQGYAPVNAADGQYGERVLLVLGCTHPGCGIDARSWRAFRCQLATTTSPPATAETTDSAQIGHPVSSVAKLQTQAEAAAGATGEPQGMTAADPFGGGFDSAEDGGGFFGEETSALDFSDLSAVLEDCATKQLQQQQLQQASERSEQRQKQQSGGAATAAVACCAGASADPVDASAPVPVPSMQLPLSGPPLPEFHILAVEEPSGRGEAMRSADEEHVQRLLEDYERQEQMVARRPAREPTSASRLAGVGSGSGIGSSQSQQQQDAHSRAAGVASEAGRSAAAARMDGGSSGANASGGSLEARAPSDSGDDMESWAGEEYEEDHVRGVQGAYLKFSARLSRQPDQCARYSRGGDVLWPLKEAPQPPPCEACGAPRAFELQLMAPLLAMVLDCAEWLDGPELAKHRPAINAAANWDFTTLAVYTCTANCHHSHEHPRAGAASAGAPAAAGAGVQAAGAAVGPVLVAEEFVMVVTEEECHVPEELKLAK